MPAGVSPSGEAQERSSENGSGPVSPLGSATQVETVVSLDRQASQENLSIPASRSTSTSALLPADPSQRRRPMSASKPKPSPLIPNSRSITPPSRYPNVPVQTRWSHFNRGSGVTDVAAESHWSDPPRETFRSQLSPYMSRCIEATVPVAALVVGMCMAMDMEDAEVRWVPVTGVSFGIGLVVLAMAGHYLSEAGVPRAELGGAWIDETGSLRDAGLSHETVKLLKRDINRSRNKEAMKTNLLERIGSVATRPPTIGTVLLRTGLPTLLGVLPPLVPWFPFLQHNPPFSQTISFIVSPILAYAVVVLSVTLSPPPTPVLPTLLCYTMFFFSILGFAALAGFAWFNA